MLLALNIADCVLFFIQILLVLLLFQLYLRQEKLKNYPLHHKELHLYIHQILDELYAVLL